MGETEARDTPQQQIAAFRAKLEAAVRDERYEEAAKVRDILQALEAAYRTDAAWPTYGERRLQELGPPHGRERRRTRRVQIQGTASIRLSASGTLSANIAPSSQVSVPAILLTLRWFRRGEGRKDVEAAIGDLRKDIRAMAIEGRTRAFIQRAVWWHAGSCVVCALLGGPIRLARTLLGLANDARRISHD